MPWCQSMKAKRERRPPRSLYEWYLRAGDLRCRECGAKPPPVPVWDDVVKATGLSRRTVYRAAAGGSVSHDTALALHQHTGVSIKALRRGTK